MSSTLRRASDHGPWFFEKPMDIDLIIKKLNSMLSESQRVVVDEFDTAEVFSMSPQLKGGFYNATADQRCEVRPEVGSGVEVLRIPIALGINLRTTALEFKGKTYPAMLDILGDRITVTVPYLFGTPTRVVHRMFAITVLSP